MPVLIVPYTVYKFDPPDLSSDVLASIAATPYETFQASLDAQLAKERREFQMRYPIMRHVFTIWLVLVCLGGVGAAAYYYLASRHGFSPDPTEQGWCLWPLPFVFLGIFVVLGYGKSFSSFISYSRQKRSYYLSTKRHLDHRA